MAATDEQEIKRGTLFVNSDMDYETVEAPGPEFDRLTMNSILHCLLWLNENVLNDPKKGHNLRTKLAEGIKFDVETDKSLRRSYHHWRQQMVDEKSRQQQMRGGPQISRCGQPYRVSGVTQQTTMPPIYVIINPNTPGGASVQAVTTADGTPIPLGTNITTIDQRPTTSLGKLGPDIRPHPVGPSTQDRGVRSRSSSRSSSRSRSTSRSPTDFPTPLTIRSPTSEQIFEMEQDEPMLPRTPPGFSENPVQGFPHNPFPNASSEFRRFVPGVVSPNLVGQQNKSSDFSSEERQLLGDAIWESIDTSDQNSSKTKDPYVRALETEASNWGLKSRTLMNDLPDDFPKKLTNDFSNDFSNDLSNDFSNEFPNDEFSGDTVSGESPREIAFKPRPPTPTPPAAGHQSSKPGIPRTNREPSPLFESKESATPENCTGWNDPQVSRQFKSLTSPKRTVRILRRPLNSEDPRKIQKTPKLVRRNPDGTPMNFGILGKTAAGMGWTRRQAAVS